MCSCPAAAAAAITPLDLYIMRVVQMETETKLQVGMKTKPKC